MASRRNSTIVGIIGVGAIATAIVEGVVRTDSEVGVVLSPRSVATSAALASRFPAVTVAPDNQAVVDGCEVVLVCVRPSDAETVLASLRFRAGQTVISAMAGVRLAMLRALASPATVCRAIPLPAVAQRRGPTPIFPGVAAARMLFDRLGAVIVSDDEAQFDAFSAVTATIAAHIAYLATIADWLTQQGVHRADADRYVAGIFSTLDLKGREPQTKSSVYQPYNDWRGLQKIVLVHFYCSSAAYHCQAIVNDLSGGYIPPRLRTLLWVSRARNQERVIASYKPRKSAMAVRIDYADLSSMKQVYDDVARRLICDVNYVSASEFCI